MRNSIHTRTIAFLLIFIMVFSEGISAHPMDVDPESLDEIISDETEKTEKTDESNITGPMPEKVAKGYLELLSTEGIRWSSAECALIPVSDSVYPDFLIWDHEEPNLKIYKMDEEGNDLYCGEIELPGNDDFEADSEYHVYYHEKEGMIDLEVINKGQNSQYTVYSLENINVGDIEEGESVPLLWSGRKGEDFYSGQMNRKLICGLIMTEEGAFFDLSGSSASFMSYPAMVGYLKSQYETGGKNISLDDSLWTCIYIAYLNQFPFNTQYLDYDKAELIYLDGDDVPEILLHSSSITEESGNMQLPDVLLSIDGTNVIEHKMSYYNDLSYIPYKNTMLKTESKENMVIETVYTSEAGKDKQLFCGERLGDHIEKPETLTKEEYDTELNAVFDMSKAVEVRYGFSINGLREELRGRLYKSFQKKENNWINAYQYKLLKMYAGEVTTGTAHEGGYVFDYYRPSDDEIFCFQVKDITCDGIPELLYSCMTYWRACSFNEENGYDYLLGGYVADDPVEKKIYSIHKELEDTPCYRYVYEAEGSRVSLLSVFAEWPKEYTFEVLGEEKEKYYLGDMYTDGREEISLEEGKIMVKEYEEAVDIALKRSDTGESFLFNIPNIANIEELSGYYYSDTQNYLTKPSDNISDENAALENRSDTKRDNDEDTESEIDEVKWKKMYSDYLDESSSELNITYFKAALVNLNKDSAPELLLLGKKNDYSIGSTKVVLLSLNGADVITGYYEEGKPQIAYIPEEERIRYSYVFGSEFRDEILSTLNDEQNIIFYGSYYTEDNPDTFESRYKSSNYNYKTGSEYVAQAEYKDVLNNVYDLDREVVIDTWYPMDSIKEMLNTPGKLVPGESGIYTESQEDSDRQNKDNNTDDEIFDAFLNNEIYAYYPDNFEYPGEPFKYEERYHGEDDINSLKETGRIDVNNDGKKDLVMEDYYGETYFYVKDGKLYVLAEPDGTAVRTSHTYYDGAEWIVIRDMGHGGRQSYWLAKYNGDGEIVDEFGLSAEYWDSPDYTYHEDSEFTFRDKPITMEEFERLRYEILGIGEPPEESEGDNKAGNEDNSEKGENKADNKADKEDRTDKAENKAGEEGVSDTSVEEKTAETRTGEDNTGDRENNGNTAESDDTVSDKGNDEEQANSEIHYVLNYIAEREGGENTGNDSTGDREDKGGTAESDNTVSDTRDNDENKYPAWDLDKEAEVKSILEWNEEMLENRSNYDFHDYGGYSYYSIDKDPVYIVVRAGYDDWEPSRYYYGYDIFYVEVEYSPSRIRKYYYSDYKLFRVETEDGRVIDYGSKDWDKYNEEGLRLKEEREAICSVISGGGTPSQENNSSRSGSESPFSANPAAEPADTVRSRSGKNINDLSAEELANEILIMNQAHYGEISIDLTRRSYSPGKRDYDAIWDKTVFYVLEGYETATGYTDKNLCEIEKKQLKNASTGNLIQYEIYKNPETGVANKIVSIEYLENGLEVTEYYYTNQKQVSFIFRYKTDNYISTYATTDKHGERYMFEDDSMVTWRIVSDGFVSNTVIGENEAGQIENFSKNTIHVYDSLSPEDKREFDEKEIEMLNEAYITFEVVLASEGIASIQGYAYDGLGEPLPNAKVELYTADFTAVLYTVKTDASGRYIIYVPNETFDYNIRIKRKDFTQCEIYMVHIYRGQLSVYQESVYLFPVSENLLVTELHLGDAFNYSASGDGMLNLTGAVIHVRKGIGNRTGTVVLNAVSDMAGTVYLSLVPGVYTIEVAATGYEVMYYTIVVNPFVLINRYEFYAAPELKDNELAIVLTWGAVPFDLDSHLFTTGKGGNTQHIWFGHMSDTKNSYLDVDDITSYGPETVTIRSFNSDRYYKYCVVDYTNCAIGNYGSLDMSLSGACVNVYNSEGLAATFSVPVGSSGVIWEVFEIRNGEILPIQRYYNNVTDKSWWNSEKG